VDPNIAHNNKKKNKKINHGKFVFVGFLLCVCVSLFLIS
jgi:hypothetical protein